MSDTNPVDPITGVRQLLVFQLKLAADAVRDLVMSSVSIVMFLLDLLLRPPAQQSYHARMLRFGRQTDRWIRLFEESDQR